MSSTASAVASATSSAASGELKASNNLKVVGIILAIVSGLLIGASFVFKKKGLLRSQEGSVAGEGVAYLKSTLWWTGMIMMILGELCNFAAYAFVEAIVVTPLGALSVVICAILSSFFLNEKLSLFGWLGCALCLLGSTIIALNGPREESVGQIREFEKLFIAPGFLTFAGVLIALSLSVVFYFGPKYGKQNMLWYISVCSMIGGISVSVTSGLGAAIVTTAQGDSQFKYWFIYFLMVFVAVTLITEVYYLNVALALFNTAMVTPTYYVAFTFCSMVTTVVLFKGLSATVSQILTIVMAFFSICIGITILQMSKIDPQQLTKLDRRSTMLLQAARSNTQGMDEKDITAIEDPGIDALRGSFGAMGSIIRAKSARRMSMASRASTMRSRHANQSHGYDEEAAVGSAPCGVGVGEDRSHYPGLKRHQLYDAPMPPMPPLPEQYRARTNSDAHSVASATPPRHPTIKFDTHNLVHSYQAPGSGDGAALHEFQSVRGRSRREDPTLAHSTAATLGVGPRFSEFVAQQTPPEVEARTEDADSTASISGSGGAPSALGTSSSISALGVDAFVHSPDEERPPLPVDDRFRRAAVSGPTTPRDAYGRGEPQPGYSLGTLASTHASKDSVGSMFSEDDELLKGAGPVGGHRSTPSGGHHHLFGRNPNARHYPGGSKDEDADESRRLFKNGSASSSSEGGMSDETGSGGTMSPGGIRLVSKGPAGAGRF